jgi:hypothetical protein
MQITKQTAGCIYVKIKHSTQQKGIKGVRNEKKRTILAPSGGQNMQNPK